MSSVSHDTIFLTTPHGHEVTAEFDYEALAIRHAQVVNHYTGVIKQLDAQTADILTRALRAKRVYEQALAEVREVERTLKGFGPMAEELGKDHPALAPYVADAEKHKAIARDMFSRARHFHEDAMGAIEQLVENAKE